MAVVDLAVGLESFERAHTWWGYCIASLLCGAVLAFNIAFLRRIFSSN